MSNWEDEGPMGCILIKKVLFYQVSDFFFLGNVTENKLPTLIVLFELPPFPYHSVL